MHSTTDISPFEIVYGFNTSTPMDLIPYPIEEMVSLDNLYLKLLETILSSPYYYISRVNNFI